MKIDFVVRLFGISEADGWLLSTTREAGGGALAPSPGSNSGGLCDWPRGSKDCVRPVDSLTSASEPSSFGLLGRMSSRFLC